MQDAIEAAAQAGGYKVVATVLHDVNKIQDFSPYVAKIKAANPDTVITGNWSNDLLLLMKAAHDAGLKVRFATAFLDQPGNIANAGDIAVGDYIANSYVDRRGRRATSPRNTRRRTGHYPVFIEPQTAFAMGALQLALAKVDFHGGKINATEIAKALETVTYMSPVGPISVRKADHQTIRPVVVSKVVKDAKYPVDGTDLGFKPVSIVSGADAIYPVQASCKMKRPKLRPGEQLIRPGPRATRGPGRTGPARSIDDACFRRAVRWNLPSFPRLTA